jgi:hypothetical protein
MRVTQNATANTNRYFTGKSPRILDFDGGYDCSPEATSYLWAEYIGKKTGVPVWEISDPLIWIT